MKYKKTIHISVVAIVLLVACRLREQPNEPLFAPPYAQEFDPHDFDNFSICYSEMQGEHLTQIGKIGEIDNRPFYFESWAIPNIRGMKLKFIFIRSDNKTVKNFDFCLQELPLNENFPPDFILVSKKDENGILESDSSLSLKDVPGFVQPLVLYLNGWQALRYINRGQKGDAKLFIENRKLVFEYYTFDADENKTLVKKTYDFDGEKFIIPVTSEVDNMADSTF